MSRKAKEPEPKETEEAEEVEEEEVVEEKKVAKPKKEKVAKKKKQEKGAFRYYKTDDKDLTRLRPFCERCGPGYFMADHGNRYTCGHCGFTRYKSQE